MSKHQPSREASDIAPAPRPGAMTVVVATRNRGKLLELRELLAGLPIDLRSLDEVAPNLPPIVEDGATFEENALIKARVVAEATLLVTLADDSGLEVDALGGRPGVRSARFASDAATDAENNAALMSALEEVHGEKRTARFRSVIAVVDPFSEADPLVVEGRCEGTIAREPRGTGGFGYDPLFVFPELERSMAELSESEKNELSHRGKAAVLARAFLADLCAARLRDARAIAESA
jgi:XTP/dITP diphosphohydrolase